MTQFGESCSVLAHTLAISFAVSGLVIVIMGPLDSTIIYGIALFGMAIALDVIVAAQCEDKNPRRGRDPRA